MKIFLGGSSTLFLRAILLSSFAALEITPTIEASPNKNLDKTYGKPPKKLANKGQANHMRKGRRR